LAQNPTEPNFQALLEQAELGGVRAAVLVDMTGPLLDTTDEVVDALAKVRDDHGQHAAYLTVEGRPVLFFLGQDAFSLPTWEAVRNAVDPDHTMIWIAAGEDVGILDIFDGLYLYNVAEVDELATLLDDWSSKVRFWSLQHATPRYWVATVMPGYDDTATAPDNEALVRARQGGTYYRDSWSAADASGPDWIIIRSFNDWMTCTYIESSEVEGDVYLTLTSEMISQYEAPAQPTVTPTPTEAPVLVTPTVTLPAVTPTVTPTLTPSPTPWITPTVTLTPSATPFRLATPTSRPGEVTPDVNVTYAPSDGEGEAPSQPETAPPGPGAPSTPTITPIPRLPVEGYPSRRRCSLLPLLLPFGAAVLARRRR
jgi:cell division septation protein DedD